MIKVDIVLNNYKLERSKIAKQLGYDDDVISNILDAKSENEVDSILRQAREDKRYI